MSAADRERVTSELNERGYGRLGNLISREDANALRALYADDAPFRSRVVMQKHNFGKGEYRYLKYPLPEVVQTLRERLYRELAPVANVWQERMGKSPHFPETHAEFRAKCAELGQTRPTPLILRYGSGDFNCLHQDLYGECSFPLQAVILLSDSHEFDGGEFVLTEQRPRMQSRVEVVPLAVGHGVVFAVNERPQRGTRGFYRVKHRHGVSPVRRGERLALGIIFHDAA